MAYVTRSMQGVRQITPLSSRILRESEKYSGKAKEALQLKAAEEGLFEVKRGTPNNLTRESESAAKRAIMAGQKMSIQGDFNPNDIVSPLKQEFFNSMGGMPQFQQEAILDKYSDNMRQQRMLNQAEQKSYLELREAQRKARMTQAADALQIPVSRRIEEIMSSGLKDRKKFESLQQSLFENPEALGNPLIANLYGTAFKNVGEKIDAKAKKKNIRDAQEYNMLSQAAASGNTEFIDYLKSNKGKGSSKKFNTAIKLAEANKEVKEKATYVKQYDSALTAAKEDLNSLTAIGKMIPPTKLQGLEFNAYKNMLVKKQQGIAIDKQTEAFANFVKTAKFLLSAEDDFEADTEGVRDLIKLLVRAGINDEALTSLLGDDAKKLKDVSNYTDLIVLLESASNILAMQGSAPDAVMQAEADAEADFNR